jgi:hypothetical protein
MAGDWCIMTNKEISNQELRESGIAKLVLSTGITEAELRALGLTSDGDN